MANDRPTLPSVLNRPFCFRRTYRLLALCDSINVRLLVLGILFRFASRSLNGGHSTTEGAAAASRSKKAVGGAEKRSLHAWLTPGTDHEGRQFWVVAAERKDAGRFIVHAPDMPTAFVELPRLFIVNSDPDEPEEATATATATVTATATEILCPTATATALATSTATTTTMQTAAPTASSTPTIALSDGRKNKSLFTRVET
jgi:hypothetical protein